MTRFLTPSKIGLLALIELYTDANVPTASTIPILSFILNQLLPGGISKSQPKDPLILQTLPFILDIKAFETLLSAHASAAGLPGRTLWDYFLKKLWDIDSLDALHVFFDMRSGLLAKTRDDAKKEAEMGIPTPSPDMIILSRTSPFGTFIRRAQVEFDRLRFNDAVALWASFKRWRQETQIYWAKRNGDMNRWTGDRALLEGRDEWGLEETDMLELVAYAGLSIDELDEGRVSTDDVEKLLEFQVEQMQSQYCIN
jgi:anaphase-promoting complex subunit 5